MSEGGEKRFEATPSRRRRAVREGQSARSTELSSVVAFASAACAAAFTVPVAFGASATLLRDAAGSRARPDTPAALVAAALAPAAAAAAAAVLAGLAQAGGVHLTALRVDVRRVDPLAGAKRLASREMLVALARAACAFGAALLAVAPVVRDAVAAARVVKAPAAAAGFAGWAAAHAAFAVAGAGAAFALVDVALARRRWLRGLRMSLDELKRDAKENEGDPHARARRKSAHRAAVRGGIGRTREASFVVVNPTHVAVALRYAPPTVPVPEILVRALDDAAVRVRALASRHRIPVVEEPALARLLYAQGESGRAIPVEAYVAVAEVVAALARAGLGP